MDHRAAPGSSRPVIAMAMDGPAGISPELTAKLLAGGDVSAFSHLVVIGDRRVLDDGAAVAGVTPDLEEAGDAGTQTSRGRPAFLQGGRLDTAAIRRRVAPANARARKQLDLLIADAWVGHREFIPRNHTDRLRAP